MTWCAVSPHRYSIPISHPPLIFHSQNSVLKKKILCLSRIKCLEFKEKMAFYTKSNEWIRLNSSVKIYQKLYLVLKIEEEGGCGTEFIDFSTEFCYLSGLFDFKNCETLVSLSSIIDIQAYSNLTKLV